MEKVGYAIAWFTSLIGKNLEKIVGYLLLLPSFMVVLSLLMQPGTSNEFRGYGSGWSRYFFRHLWKTVDESPIPEANLSISLIIIAMAFSGVYLIKSKQESK